MRFYLKQGISPKHPKIYYVCWTGANGRGERRSTRTSNLQEAEVALDRIRLEVFTPRDLRPEQTLLREVMLNYWIKHAEEHDPLVTTYAIADIKRHLPEMTVAGFNLDEQKKYIKALEADGQSASTINRRITSLVAALNLAKDSGMFSKVPKITRADKTYTVGQKPFTLNELQRLFAVARTENDKRALVLWTTTFCRPAYILDITWAQVSAEAQTIDYRVPGIKVNRKRRACVPMGPTLSAFMEERRERDSAYVIKNLKDGKSPLTDFDNTIERMVERAGIEGGAYRIRKYSASYLANRATPDVVIKAYMGHKFTEGPLPAYIVAEMQRALPFIEEILSSMRVDWLPTVASPLRAASANPLFSQVAANDAV